VQEGLNNMVKNTTKTKKSPSAETEEKTEKPFDFFRFVDDVSFRKQNLFNEETEAKYEPYMINKALSLSVDCVLYVNELNLYYDLPKVMQHDYLINSIRSRKRYEKWPKPEKNEDFQAVKEYYKYNDAKTRTALSILDKKQIAIIKEKLEKGGVTK
jgi:hypothetical protein